ncbi:MAG: cytochrome c biogenesis protein CcdA [Pyrinomonadaceae bacterium]
MTNGNGILKFLTKPSGKSLLLIIHCLVFVLGAYAQNPVSWSLNAAKSVKAGAKFDARLSAGISGGWYLCSLTQPPGGPNATRITLPSEQAFKLASAIKAPSPKIKFDENFGINTESYAGSVTFTIPLTVSTDAQTGKQTLAFNVRFQVCNETTCLPPRTVKVETPVEIASSSTALANTNANVSPTVISQTSSPTPTPKSTPLTTTAPVENSISAERQSANSNVIAEITGGEKPEERQFSIKDEGGSESNQPLIKNQNLDGNQLLLSFLWLAATVGALSLLTPCVFPMIPITVSYFTNHSAGHRSKVVKLASVYSLGIILTFTLLGMLLAIFVGASGINLFAANPYVNLLIAAIFLFFAFNLFGAYEITVPTRVLTKFDNLTRNKEGEGSGIVGALLMGLTFTLTSFTCTSPFVGTILVSASQGSWQMPLLGMLAFSTVFALPFFVLALVPQWIAQLPRAGGWMNSIKVSMGFLEIAAAMKFLSNVDLVWKWEIFTRPVVLAMWIAVGILLSLYLLGKFQLFHDSKPERIGAGRLLSAIVSLTVSFYLLTGLFGAPLGELESFLPPELENSQGFSRKSNELNWMKDDFAGALRQAKAENKRVFVDFTGYTCTNCRWMEANVFPKREVEDELEKFVRVKLFTDGECEIYERQQQFQEQTFQTVALPFYAVFDADGKPIETFPGLTRHVPEFVEFLQKSVYP